MAEQEPGLNKEQLQQALKTVRGKMNEYTLKQIELQGQNMDDLRSKIINSISGLQNLENGLAVAAGELPLEMALKVCEVEEVEGVIADPWWRNFQQRVEEKQGSINTFARPYGGSPDDSLNKPEHLLGPHQIPG